MAVDGITIEKAFAALRFAIHNAVILEKVQREAS